MRDYNEVVDEMEIVKDKIEQFDDMEIDLAEIMELTVDESLFFYNFTKKLEAKLTELNEELGEY